MNKKILSLIVAGMLIMPTTGCNARLTIGGKEMFNFSDNVQQENVIQNDKTNKAEEKKKETKQQEEKKETETKKEYCDWCEDYADHSTDEHMAQCYDCGEYKKAKDMEFNGRSFHCGCVDEEPTEELLICPNCGKKYPASEMCEDYCPECYEELFIDGDSEVNSELWVCPDCGGSYPESEMIEDTENGVWYCYSCYDELMYDRMGGDANGDLEDWEY